MIDVAEVAAIKDAVMRHALSIDQRGKHTDEPTPIRFAIDPGDASAQTVADVLIALSDLHRAYGGRALHFELEDGQFVARERE